MASMSVRKLPLRNILKHSCFLRQTTALGWVTRNPRQFSATAEQSTEASEAEKQLQEQITTLTKENETLTEKVADLQDKYRRTLADRENVRLRLEKQIVDAKQYGIQGFCKDLLEVSDVFRKAIESVTEEQVQKGSPELKNLYDGLVMTETQLLSVFRRHGLEQINPAIGEKFDPSQQEAMFELPLPDKAPGTVAHTIRLGWTLHSRCIRSAQVGVVKDN
ncbi:grpE protein homolog 1, mitochondrial-like [Penaeus chinensis]|uniref:grpE protein homolog 1, mitochondrial-like n=1 Tax=Penaeus chinensis TaxID=139456 RepID=UPI001FB6A9A6|nr:grpE protein homolog 1, mitochondrial-like [Penaeus chinensis]